MTMIETIILGVVQGLTEFLPISSSGHLVLFQNLLGFREPEILLNCALHVGTLVAVCSFFREELLHISRELLQWISGPDRRRFFDREYAPLALWVVVGSVPTALIGLVFRRPLEQLFASVHTVGWMLAATGAIVALTRWIPETYSVRLRLGFLTALAVGTAQGLAIIPGISRSGATIVCALLLGIQRQRAGQFSFLLSIPAIVGATFLQWNGADIARVGWGPLTAGFLSSAIVGFLALKLLMGMVKRGHLYYFAPYCWALALTVLLL